MIARAMMQPGGIFNYFSQKLSLSGSNLSSKKTTHFLNMDQISLSGSIFLTNTIFVGTTTENDCGIFANQDFTKGELIIQIPRNLILTAEDAREYPELVKMFEELDPYVDEDDVLSITLLYHYYQSQQSHEFKSDHVSSNRLELAKIMQSEITNTFWIKGYDSEFEIQRRMRMLHSRFLLHGRQSNPFMGAEIMNIAKGTSFFEKAKIMKKQIQEKHCILKAILLNFDNLIPVKSFTLTSVNTINLQWLRVILCQQTNSFTNYFFFSGGFFLMSSLVNSLLVHSMRFGVMAWI
jgi:hypothetical protein